MEQDSAPSTIYQKSARKPAEEIDLAPVEKKSAFYQDTAMVRYRITKERPNYEVKVLKDNELINEL